MMKQQVATVTHHGSVLRRRSNSPKCVSWASPSEVSSKKIRNDTQELMRSENMDRCSVGALTLLR